MAERFLHLRKITAAQRRCLEKGKSVMREEDGKIICATKSVLSRKDQIEANSSLKAATVERLKSFLTLKGFHGFSRLKKQELIDLIFRYTDPYTGHVILYSPRKSRTRIKSKESRRKHRVKESRRKRK